MMNNNLVKVLIALASAVLLYYLVSTYSNRKTTLQSITGEDGLEGFHGDSGGQDLTDIGPSEQLGTNETYSGVDGEYDNQGKFPADCFPRDQITPSELLPGHSENKWSDVNPMPDGELNDQNFLEAGHHVGVNTVGQSLRNANRQLRSEPSNPDNKVSPWMQTTIGSDLNRRPLEIGGC